MVFYYSETCYSQSRVDSLVYENIGLKRAIDDFTKELDLRKNRKFQDKCILIAQILLDKEPLIDFFLQKLELDAFFQKYQIALEVQVGFIAPAGIKDSKNLRLL